MTAPQTKHSSERAISVGGLWPIERTWTLLVDGARREQARTTQLSDYRACGILGAAGLGKTCELHHLAALDRESGFDVRMERLAVLGQTADGGRRESQCLRRRQIGASIGLAGFTGNRHRLRLLLRSEGVAHFGLGQEEKVDLEIILPGGKGKVVQRGIKADQRVSVTC